MSLFYILTSPTNPAWYLDLEQILKKNTYQVLPWSSAPAQQGIILYWPGYVSERWFDGFPLSLHEELQVLPFLLNTALPIRVYGYSQQIPDAHRVATLAELMNLKSTQTLSDELFTQVYQNGKQSYAKILRRYIGEPFAIKLEQRIHASLHAYWHGQIFGLPECLKPFRALITEETPRSQQMMGFLSQTLQEAFPELRHFLLDQTSVFQELSVLIQSLTQGKKADELN